LSKRRVDAPIGALLALCLRKMVLGRLIKNKKPTAKRQKIELYDRPGFD
jgi:hypothetical protein